MKDLVCKDMMPLEKNCLLPGDTVSKAFKLMRSKGMRFLAVINENDVYLGVFTSPTLIRLMLPRAMTIEMGGKNANKGLHNLNFLNMSEKNFFESLSEVKDEPVINHLSDPKSIPIASPNTPIMEGILLLHQYKRHVILVEPDTGRFVGILSINSVLLKIFGENHTI